MIYFNLNNTILNPNIFKTQIKVHFLLIISNNKKIIYILVGCDGGSILAAIIIVIINKIILSIGVSILTIVFGFKSILQVYYEVYLSISMEKSDYPLLAGKSSSSVNMGH